MIGGISEVANEAKVSEAGIVFIGVNFIIDLSDMSFANELFLFEGGRKFLHEVKSLHKSLFVVVVSELVFDFFEYGFDDGGVEGDCLFELLFEFGLEGENDFFGVFFTGEGPVLLLEVLDDSEVLFLSGGHWFGL